MGKNKIPIAALLCLILFCLTAGCGARAQKGAESSFTLEDLERFNRIDAVLEEYSSVRTQSKYYDFELPGGGRADFRQTTVFVKGNSGLNMYTDTDFGYEYAIEGRNVFHKDGGVVFITLFFDDGYYEEAYLPTITEWFAYYPSDGEEILSVSVADGTRTMVTNSRASVEDDFEMWGLPDGTIETNYKLDVSSGFLLQDVSYLITDDGNRRLLAEMEVLYGKDDFFTPPEYVGLCKNISQTRMVRFVRDPNTPQEKIFSFDVPKGVGISPATMEAYDYFTNAECTIMYDWNTGDYPDELTLYMKQVED